MLPVPLMIIPLFDSQSGTTFAQGWLLLYGDGTSKFLADNSDIDVDNGIWITFVSAVGSADAFAEIIYNGNGLLNSSGAALNEGALLTPNSPYQFNVTDETKVAVLSAVTASSSERKERRRGGPPTGSGNLTGKIRIVTGENG